MAFEQAECLLPILRLLQRPPPAVMGVDVKPEVQYALPLLAMRGLAKLASYLHRAQRLVANKEPLQVRSYPLGCYPKPRETMGALSFPQGQSLSPRAIRTQFRCW